MTGFAAPARGHHQHLLKTPKTKVTEKANKKQTLIFAYCSLQPNAVRRLLVSQKNGGPVIPSATYGRAAPTAVPTADGNGSGRCRIMAKRGSKKKKMGPVA
jgi:hypothetical protein